MKMNKNQIRQIVKENMLDWFSMPKMIPDSERYEMLLDKAMEYDLERDIAKAEYSVKTGDYETAIEVLMQGITAVNETSKRRGSRISKRQLRRIIREAYEMDHMAVESFLVQKAREYHQDRMLVQVGPSAIRELLQDDLLDNIAGDWNPEDFSDLIDRLSEAPPEDTPFRGPDPEATKRLRRQTRGQGGYTGRGAWKSRTPNK